MIIAVVTFQLKDRISVEQAKEIFLGTAPKYLGVPGLIHKSYLLSEDGMTAGGVYRWSSRHEAEAMYTPAWRNFVIEKYGSEPVVAYFDSPVAVDNESGVIAEFPV